MELFGRLLAALGISLVLTLLLLFLYQDEGPTLQTGAQAAAPGAIEGSVAATP